MQTKVKLSTTQVISRLSIGKQLRYTARKGSSFSRFVLTLDEGNVVLVGKLKTGKSLVSDPLTRGDLESFLHETPIQLRGQFLNNLGVSKCQ